MDPFEAHLTFVNLLKKLKASQSSIQEVVAFALKYYSKCGEDFWDCISQELRSGSINMRINLLYFLDSLCEASAQSVANQRGKSSSSSIHRGPGLFYVHLLQKDLQHIIECVVPESRDGLLNLQSTLQMLENWRIKRIIEPKSVEAVISWLHENRLNSHSLAPAQTNNGTKPANERISRSEIMKRIEEDRERHKLLRERRWVQRVDRSDTSQATLAAFLPNSLPPIASSKSVPPTPSDAMETDDGTSTQVRIPTTLSNDRANPQLAIDIEFENAWETSSDWNEDDIDAVYEEYILCFPGTPPQKPIK
ncbi:hypothetical protein FRC14_000547 [Serendipita sp. 396]|nr:hypothetical protein FRC14_000547 [Serendipita sp. 396]